MQHFVHALDESERHVLLHFGRHVAEIFLVRLGHDHFAEPGPIGSKHLLLYSADGQHEPAQADLARHRDLAANRPAGQQ